MQPSCCLRLTHTNFLCWQALLLTVYEKFVVAEPPGDAALHTAVAAVLERHTTTLDAELAQRAIEYRGLAARRSVAAAAVQPLPKWEQRTSLLLRRLAEKEVRMQAATCRPCIAERYRNEATPPPPPPPPPTHTHTHTHTHTPPHHPTTHTHHHYHHCTHTHSLTVRTLFLQGEDADEARERPAWMSQAETTSAAAGGTAPSSGASAAAAALGIPGSVPGTAKSVANGAADLLDLLGEACVEHPWVRPVAFQSACGA